MLFTIRGVFRGLVREVLEIAGLIGGFLAAGWVSRWVGAQWQGAQPAVALGFLKIAIILFCGFACAVLFGGLGRKLAEKLHDGWFGWVDRTAGTITGFAFGVVVATFVMLGALLSPWPSVIATAAAEARIAVPLMEGGANMCGRMGDAIPGSRWLKARFMAASARATRLVA